MRIEPLHWRALLGGLLMGCAALAAAMVMAIDLGLISPTNLELETNPWIGHVIIVLLAAVSVGGSLLGYELSRRGSERGVGWSVLVIAAAIVAVFHGSTDEDAPSDLDSMNAAHLPYLEAAQEQVVAGNGKDALLNLMNAAELAETLKHDSASLCSFAESTIKLANQMLESQFHKEARVAYAIAHRFAEECPYIDHQDLRLRQEDAAARMWLENNVRRQSQ